jgi:Flp pilus assembly protein TadG
MMPIRYPRAASAARSLGRRKGATGILFALLLIPMVMSVGLAIDFGRVYLSFRMLQGVVDSTALAGASAYTDVGLEPRVTSVATSYFSKGITTLPSGLTISAPTITTAASPVCSESGAYSVTASATAQVPMTFMSLAVKSIPVTAVATAKNPMVIFNLDFAKFNFDGTAIDADAIYWYRVPEDGSLPALSDLQLVATNTSVSAASPSSQICTNSTQKIGFAMSNSPGGNIHAAYTNAYGGTFGNTYYYYSQIFPPTLQAYPHQATDCALEILALEPDGSTVPPFSSGHCITSEATAYSSLTPQGVLNCIGLNGASMVFYWNDLGGPTDDIDYNDAVFTIQCATTLQFPVFLQR